MTRPPFLRLPNSTDQLAAWLEANVGPNTYVVVHLKRSADGVPGSRERYDDVASRFMAQLTEKIIGKNAFRRRPPGRRLLPNFVTLERASDNPHLNMLIRRPDWISLADFDQIARPLWLQSPWAKPEANAFWCEEREPGSKVAGYSLKEGLDALLVKSLSIRDELNV